MSDTPRVPQHLRRFVVEQDYGQYTEVDQAVWRFVLLQTYERLQHTAHPAYRRGLAETGISVERIPRIAEMNQSLSRFGWQAVCVDGFIPPRAFQEFQAASILPIAAEMRSLDHLTYTPAPDIIHEAAGHAPILPDAGYAAYLRAIGEVGKKAFATPDDARVYRAIFELSELKERRGVHPDLVACAEAGLEQALADVRTTSEASRMSRLYWWTAEYGLVGTPADYRLYGAGLLSSLWESHACHDPRVSKVPLSAACVEQSYDITRTQPQLFVARDFEHLFSVLGEVDARLAYRAGGERALREALASEEVATLHFRSARFVTGQLDGVLGTADEGVLSFAGRVGFGADGGLLEIVDGGAQGYRLPHGPLMGGAELNRLGPCGNRVTLRYASGACLAGELAALKLDSRGQPLSLRLTDYHLICERAGLSERGAEYVLFDASGFQTAHAGASDPAYFPDSEGSQKRVPHGEPLRAREGALLALYERALAAFQAHSGRAALPVFAEIHAELSRSFPDEWLLRWNLLECLCKLGRDPADGLRRTLEAELAALELKFSNREPIASGLRYLAALAPERAQS